MDDLFYQSATRLAQCILDRELSALEVVQAHLDRIAAVNPRLNAVVQLAAEQALAELLVREGGRVSGCDLKSGENSRRLERMGARVSEGHDPAHVGDATALVVTSAVPADHPEVVRARARGIPVLKRAEALGAVVNQGLVLAVGLPLAGFLGPDAWLERRARRRLSGLRAGLPDALDLVAVGAAAGRSPLTGMAEVASGRGPLADELAVITAEASCGVPQRQALQTLRARAPVPEVAALCGLIERRFEEEGDALY